MATPLTELLIIDPQNDFCDLPVTAGPRPALPVPGADADMRRLAAFIDRQGAALTGIRVTLDSHSPVDIAHPLWWRDAAGASPAPFTVIQAEDVRAGRWRAADPRQQDYSARYVAQLELGGRYPLVVWPEHCLLGGWGHNVHGELKAALDAWSRAQLTAVEFILKGTNPRTEHYSAVQAEVPDPADAATQPNRALIRTLAAADRIVVAGEALSHCVANTVRDLAEHLGPEGTKKLVLLTDCASPVSGFEALGTQFIEELTARGMQLARSTDSLR